MSKADLIVPRRWCRRFASLGIGAKSGITSELALCNDGWPSALVGEGSLSDMGDMGDVGDVGDAGELVEEGDVVVEEWRGGRFVRSLSPSGICIWILTVEFPADGREEDEEATSDDGRLVLLLGVTDAMRGATTGRRMLAARARRRMLSLLVAAAAMPMPMPVPLALTSSSWSISSETHRSHRIQPRNVAKLLPLTSDTGDTRSW